MLVWLVNPYGPIPSESWRDYRFKIFADELVKNNNDVSWITSSFSHHFKNQRTNFDTSFKVSDKFNIILLKTPSYRNNISFKRFFRDYVFSIKFHFFAKSAKIKPDLIIFYESPLNLFFSNVNFAKKYKIPIILDQIDLWPELIFSSLPKFLNPFKKIFIYNRKRNNRYLNGTIALAENYLNTILKESPHLFNLPHNIVYNSVETTNVFVDNANNKLLDIVSKKSNEIWAIFAGSLGPTYDLINLIKTSKKFENTNLKIFIAGDGPLENFIIKSIKYNKVVFFLGKLNTQDLNYFYNYCDIGLATYTSMSNVEMPDKFYDYSSNGLAIINSLNGEISNLIAKNNIGFNYNPVLENDLYEKLNFLINDIDTINLMKKNSIHLSKEFTKEIQMKKFINLINLVMKKK
jgi:hypothetical protein